MIVHLTPLAFLFKSLSLKRNTILRTQTTREDGGHLSPMDNPLQGDKVHLFVPRRRGIIIGQYE